MKLAFSHAHFPVTSLGFGRRVGIWFQGCPLRCNGCVAPHTWEVRPEHRVESSELLARLRPWLEKCDGVTFSGGEPFAQPDALLAMILGVRTRTTGDVLVYSGYPAARLRHKFPTILQEIDVLVPEPFIADLPPVEPFTGSGNQPLLRLTDLARERYPVGMQVRPQMNVAVTPESVMMAGIPQHGDMDRLRAIPGANFRSGRVVPRPRDKTDGLVC